MNARPRPLRIPRLPDAMRQGTADPADVATFMRRAAHEIDQHATESAYYVTGYVDGHRAGRWHAGFVGFMLGMAFVAASVQLGYWVGGMP